MSRLTRQFGHPRGLFGAVVGHLMAVKNGARSRWVLTLVTPQPGERLLEVGFGPGVDVQRVLEAVGARGRVAGVDISEVMVRQASRRNEASVREGRATLSCAGIDALPFGDGEFDAAYSINAAQFWPDLARGFGELRRVVRAGGRVVVAVQPMTRGANEQDSKVWLAKLAAGASAAGWPIVEEALGPTRPPVAAVVARN
jgi:ubiquinone/menaquinone biosynthesis C-methylase UbiE